MTKAKNHNRKLRMFALTWPIFIELLLHMLMGNADTLMLSQYSDNSVAAVGVSNQVLSIVIVLYSFISAGTSILIAQNIGARNNLAAKEISSVSLSINLAFGLVLSLAVVLLGESLLKGMNLPANLMDEARTYLMIVGGFSFFEALIMASSAILRSNGFTRDMMYITIAMNILNVIGNYIFIFGPFGLPVLGVEGVAYSTVFSRVLGVVATVFILVKRLPGWISIKQLAKWPKKHVKNLLSIGIPSAGEHLSYEGSQVIITYFVAMLGTEALTAKIYVQNITSFIFLFSLSVALGNQIIIGHKVGAREHESAYHRCMKSLKQALLLTFAASAVIAVFSEELLGIFTENTEIIKVASILILLALILEPGRAINLVVISSLKAAGDVQFPVILGILSMWGVSVTLAYLLGIHFGMGLAGIWIAFIIDEWFRGILMIWRWNKRKWTAKSFVH